MAKNKRLNTTLFNFFYSFIPSLFTILPMSFALLDSLHFGQYFRNTLNFNND